MAAVDEAHSEREAAARPLRILETTSAPSSIFRFHSSPVLFIAVLISLSRFRFFAARILPGAIGKVYKYQRMARARSLSFSPSIIIVYRTGFGAHILSPCSLHGPDTMRSTVTRYDVQIQTIPRGQLRPVVSTMGVGRAEKTSLVLITPMISCEPLRSSTTPAGVGGKAVRGDEDAFESRASGVLGGTKRSKLRKASGEEV